MLAGKLYDITCFYLTESGGTTDEVVVMTIEEQPPVKSEERQRRKANKATLNKVLLRLKDAVAPKIGVKQTCL